MIKCSSKHDFPRAEKDQLISIIRSNSRPLQPIQTDIEPKIKKIGGLKAILFDIYGTLLISGSGDIGTAQQTSRSDILSAALDKCDIKTKSPFAGEKGLDLMFAQVGNYHDKMTGKGIESPEIDICEIWEEVLEKLFENGYIASRPEGPKIRRLAVEYECRANPTWPMPRAKDIINRIAENGNIMGIISNAQFFTPLFLEAFFDSDPACLGFCNHLRFWSWECGIAKPSKFMYDKAAAELLSRHDIAAEETLYVGNDMLNDILPAREAGFRTVLFAGDRRSLRLRADEKRCHGIEPDLVINNLLQLRTVAF